MLHLLTSPFLSLLIVVPLFLTAEELHALHEHDGAPKRTGIDLDGGTARIAPRDR